MSLLAALFRKPSDWEQFRKRWKRKYGGYAKLPEAPMTKDQAKDYLTERHPCGCTINWWASPPSGWGCKDHMRSITCFSPPDYFLYANEVLRS